MRKLFTTLSIFCFSINGFSQENPLFNYIPKDANTVMHVDLLRLFLKIPASTLKSSFFYKEIMKHPEASFLTMLGDSRKTGIDYTSGIMIVIKENGSGMSKIPGVSIFIKLDDPTTFTERMKELTKEKGNIKKYGTDMVMVSESMSAGWNNDVFVLTSEYDQSIMSEFYGNTVTSDTTIGVSMDTTAVTEIVLPDTTTFDYSKYHTDYKKLMEKVQRSRRDACFELLTPKKQNPISQDPEFIAVMNEKADMKTWSYQHQSSIPVELLGIAPFLQNLESLTGKKGTSVLNFENGKVVVKSDNFPEGPLAELYKSQPAGTHTNNLVARAPKEGRFGMFSLSLDAEFAKGLKKQFSLEELFAKANEDADEDDKFDYSLLNGAVKSQAMLVLMNNKPDTAKEKDDEYASFRYKGPLPLVAVEIADLAKFELLKAAILKSYKKDRRDDIEDDDLMVIKNNDKIAVLTTNEKIADEFLTSANNEIPSWISSNSDYPFLGNLDFVSLFNALTKSIDDGQHKRPFEETLNNSLDQLYLYGGKYEDGKVKTNIELTFKDKNKNSLVQLFDLLNNLGQLFMKDREEDNSLNYKGDKQIIEEVTITSIKEEEKKIEPPPPPRPKKKN